jgi:hypothetical protein
MKQHWRLVHNTPAADGNDLWKSVPLQTFFRGNALRYFTNAAFLVSTPAALSDSSDALTSDISARTVSDRAVCSNSVRSCTPINSVIASDQGLLDHYRNHTYKTLSCTSETQDAFGVTVVELASRFPFLLHGVLACSALHLASTDPDNRTYYTIQSMRYQDQALPAFRWATMHVDLGNCQAVLAFSFFLVICALSSQFKEQSLFLYDDDENYDQTHWINLLRNGCSMLCPVWDDLNDSPVAPFTALWRDDLGATANPNDPLLVTLLSVFPEHEPEYPILRDSAMKLVEAFAFMKQRGQSSTIWDALNSWSLRVMPEYLALLNRNCSGALLLLAYYGVLLRPIRGEWFLEGRSRKLMDEIARRLQGNCSPQIWGLFVEIKNTYSF